MASFDNIAAAIKKEIAALESNSKTKQSEIEQAYKDAIKAADDKRKKDLEQISKSKSELKQLKKLYKDTTGKNYTADESELNDNKANIEATEKPSKQVKLATKFEEAKGNKEKIIFVLNEIKSGINDAIINKLFTYDSETKGKTVNLELSQLYKAGVIKVIGKEGKKNIYSL
ncbi:hypothetical protein [Mucilaginibacter sp. 3215]|uniref:hypothetical protein n=1 Tax=Mucilaginibacter sp. 3215 TaxID=3373912 RepID=UPI003D23F942